MISTLLLDLDGTLVDSKAAFNELFDGIARSFLGDESLSSGLIASFRRHCADAFYTLPHRDYYEAIGWGWDNMFYTDFSGDDPRLADLENVAKDYKRSILATVLNVYGILSETLLEQVLAFMYDKWADFYRPYPDTHDILDQCGEYRKFILTNGLVDIQMKKIQHCGLLDKVDGICISGMYGVGKPDPRYYDCALRHTGVRPDAAVMIGNSLSDDIIGAAGMGMKTVWIKRDGTAEDMQDVGPTADIESLYELPGVLRAL